MVYVLIYIYPYYMLLLHITIYDCLYCILCTVYHTLCRYDNGENWNQRFQTLLELRENTIEDRIYKYSCLSSLNNDFVEASTLYAKAIISEYYLHVKDKTILDRSAAIGGLAGGEKFLWRGILFKLANGEKTGPWNGNDEYAAKGAGHELKNTIHYYTAGHGLIKNIRYPLMALIDYCGFRMVCQAFLPIEGSKSLVYGSNDGGMHVAKSSATFNQYMEVLCNILKLKPHSVGRNRRELVELQGPVDVEGHWGQDGLYYLLDLQRGFPAESPLATPHLQTLIPTGARVKVVIPNTHAVMSAFEVDGTILSRRVTRVHSSDAREMLASATYDIIIVNKSVCPPKISVLRRIPASDVKYVNMTIFHRLLR